MSTKDNNLPLTIIFFFLILAGSRTYHTVRNTEPRCDDAPCRESLEKCHRKMEAQAEPDDYYCEWENAKTGKPLYYMTRKPFPPSFHRFSSL